MKQDFTQLRPTRAIIHLDRLRENYRILRNLLGESQFFCAMVKANAYGHGDISVSQALFQEGVRHFGVALVEEGIQLRRQGLQDCQILVFGNLNQAPLSVLFDHQLTPVLSRWDELRWLEDDTRSRVRLPVHLEFNTGMNRLGFNVDDVISLRQFFAKSQSLILQGCCTHFSDGEDIIQEGGKTSHQIHLFQRALRAFKGLDLVIHVHNSAGLVGAALTNSMKSLCSGWGARPGLSLYGILPEFSGLNSRQEDFLQKLNICPVMELRSQVAHAFKVNPGSAVSYGGTWVAPKESLLGLIPIGYGDGYFRGLSNVGEVYVDKHKAPVVGTICMDSILVDLTHCQIQMDQAVGKEVLLLGQSKWGEIPVEDVARKVQTIPYEILVAVGARVPRHYTNELGAK